MELLKFRFLEGEEKEEERPLGREHCLPGVSDLGIRKLGPPSWGTCKLDSAAASG